MIWEQEAMRLRAEVARLEEENAWLKSELGDGVVFPLEWGLKASQQVALAAIYRCRAGACPQSRVLAALEHRAGRSGYIGNIVAVNVSKIRILLRPRFGSDAISSHCRIGYRLSVRLRRAIDRYQEAAGLGFDRRRPQQELASVN